MGRAEQGRRVQRFGRELWIALGIIAAGTALYLAVVARQGAIPAAGHAFGHGLGIAGFVLMLMTETLYSARKRARRARWGSMAAWLQFHIVTGLVGPYLVLLHTAWRFNGLAGVVALMAGVVVASGFIGRYIYTAVPRTAAGIEVEDEELRAQIAAAEAEIQAWMAARPGADAALASRVATLPDVSGGDPLLVLGRAFLDWGTRRQWRQERRRLDGVARAQARELEALVRRRRVLGRQAASLVTARRLLAVWHAVHIPLGVALFTAALIHIGAALYYATLLR